MVKYTLKILPCEHRNTFEVYQAICQLVESFKKANGTK